MGFDSGIMQFGGYTFAYNPHKLTLQKTRRITTYPLASSQTTFQEQGFAPMVIRGEGTLSGDAIMAQLVELEHLLEEKGSGLLCLPQLSPMYCYFTELTVTGKAGPQLLTYQFTFVEDTERKLNLQSTSHYLLTSSGDTVATVAAKGGVTVETLLQNNPHLAGKVTLEEGDVAWLP